MMAGPKWRLGTKSQQPKYGSSDQESMGSDHSTKRSSISSTSRSHTRKEFFHKFVDSNMFTSKLEDWFQMVCGKGRAFDVPFELIELQKFDYALEGMSFQQLVRMPSAVYASTSNAAEATAYLAVEDFLHASVKGLWEAFWDQDASAMPFSVACLSKVGSKFLQAENAIASGKLGELSATAVMLKSSGKMGNVLELSLLRPDIGNLALDSNKQPPVSVLGEAFFYALRVLLSRKTESRKCRVFVILVDSQYGGVVRVEGDVNILKFDAENVYECAAEWIKKHARIAVSPVDRIWNKLGNANWGDIGTLQILFATFHSMTQFVGTPNHSVEDLAADHGSKLQVRRRERQSGVTRNSDLCRLQKSSVSSEIVEVRDETMMTGKDPLKLEVGSVLCVEGSDWRLGYHINEASNDGEIPFYIVSLVEESSGKLYFLYVGSHPSQPESAWEGMNLWYQVQRQTKVLTVMKQRGVSSKHLPQLSASGKIIHPGQCRGKGCDHPWCGTPVLAIAPVGDSVSDLFKTGRFERNDALDCCRDCLSALSAAASVGIRHGDIRPENVIRVGSGRARPYFVIIGWGHAILEERDRPAMNLHFSSTYALQEGKVCAASDAESLVYLAFFCGGGGARPELDSVEGALQWREESWSSRRIQKGVGEISTLLKAFADYVDSLCGTPYPMDYEIWLRRFRNCDVGNGKEISLD